MTFIILLIMTAAGSIGSILLKKATNCNNILKILFSKSFIIGCLIYFLGCLLNILLLKYLDYSEVLPLTSITYIWTLLFARIFLKEEINFKKVLGVGCIFVGAILVCCNSCNILEL